MSQVTVKTNTKVPNHTTIKNIHQQKYQKERITEDDQFFPQFGYYLSKLTLARKSTLLLYTDLQNNSNSQNHKKKKIPTHKKVTK